MILIQRGCDARLQGVQSDSETSLPGNLHISMTDSAFRRSPELLSQFRSRLLVIDVQEKLIPTIHDNQAIVRRIEFLLDSAQQLSVPVTVSEQYPTGLGPTIPALARHPAVGHTFDKVRFSACEPFCDLLKLGDHIAPDAHDGRDQILLVGIEAHVCVLQTAFDLTARGFRVYVAEDAVGSGAARDHAVGVQRLRDAGITICTAEGAAFEWCETAEAEQFRAMSKLIRGLRA
jgi:nicotinamidase-related amidase